MDAEPFRTDGERRSVLGGRPDPRAPGVDYPTFVHARLREMVLAGGDVTELCEEVLAQASRAAAALDIGMGDGLAALTVGSRLDELSFSNLGDYAENILGMDRRTAQAAAQLSRALGSRPTLRAAVRAGLVRPRNALAVLPVAKGEAEAEWAKRASRETVRALEAAVKAERTGRTGALPGPDITEEMAAEEEEPRIEFRLPVRDLTRPDVMEALAIAEAVLESPVRYQHLEALAQEYLGSHPLDEDRVREAERITLRRRQRLPRKPDPEEEERREREAEGWTFLTQPEPIASPDLDGLATVDEIDLTLCGLANERRSWDDLLGFCALKVMRSGVAEATSFASFKHYAKERLGLAPRTVEQRAALERQLLRVPALLEAKEAGLSYSKLRILSTLPYGDIRELAEKARTLTVVELREAVDVRLEAHMCASRDLRVWMPVRVAVLFDMALLAARHAEGYTWSDSECLARIARNFTEIWKGEVSVPKTPSQKARAKAPRCQAPGCSRRATEGHHIWWRSRGGPDEPWNILPLCGFHHHRVVHGGFAEVTGRFPESVEWVVKGKRWVDAKFGRD